MLPSRADSRIPIWFVEKDTVVYIIYQSERGFTFRDESKSVFHRSAAPSVQRTIFFWDGHFGLENLLVAACSLKSSFS